MSNMMNIGQMLKEKKNVFAFMKARSRELFVLISNNLIEETVIERKKRDELK